MDHSQLWRWGRGKRPQARLCPGSSAYSADRGPGVRERHRGAPHRNLGVCFLGDERRPSVLAWMGDSCSLLSRAPFPTSSCSFPSFKRRECPRGLQATLQSPSPRAEARQTAPVWSLIGGITQKEESQIPGKECAAGWGDTPGCRARAGRKLSKILSEADRDISAALPSPFC